MVDEKKLSQLIEEMVRLLITYEIELTSYQTVYDALGKSLADAGVQIDVRKMVQLVAQSRSLHAEAEAEYAAFIGLTRVVTAESVEGALTSIRQTIDNRNRQAE